LARYSRDVPEALEWIVTKTLRKNRDERYQTAKELLADLRQLKQRLEFSAEQERSASSTVSNEATRAAKISEEVSQAQAPRTIELTPAQTTSSAEYIVNQIKRHKTGAIVGLTLAIVGCLGLAYGMYRLAFRSKPTFLHFQNMKITKLTTTGNVSNATISPDGRYVVYTVSDDKLKSLWTKYLPTGSTVEVVAPADASLLGMTTFSPDGNFVYYCLQDANHTTGALFRVPVLGGTSKKVLDNVRFPITFSPDGKRFAFARVAFDFSKSSLVIANADGTEERQLPDRADNERCLGGLAWAPDGKTIACGAIVQNAITISSFAIDSDRSAPLTSRRFTGGARVAWFKDGSGLVFIARAPLTPVNAQVWQLAYPSGEVRRITNDLNGYGWASLGVTADNSTIVVSQTERHATVWLTPANTPDAAHARQITTRGQQMNGESGLAWTPDGKLVYSSIASGNYDIWIMSADGTQQKQLTDDPDYDGGPLITPDGRHIVFYSARSDNLNVWRMDIDGSNLTQLTHEQRLSAFDLTRDGKWIVYSVADRDTSVIRRVSIEGGTPMQIREAVNGDSVCVSPDGTVLAYFDASSQSQSTKQIVVAPISGSAPLRTFEAPANLAPGSATSFLSWSPDGRSLLYIGRSPGANVGGIWRQPLDGGPPTLFASFAPDAIFSFAFSRDGKQIAFARGSTTSDAVLISEVK
ncbi:MAG TPA: hypothetical protein VKD91_19575, partial [Pyrinomonadaceae bacterium]|nr:hypothetical protein [Pyrinomonadaceae bacterium]